MKFKLLMILGDGLEVTNHSKVSVHIGRLEDNNEFDNSYKNQHFIFKLVLGK